MLLLAAKNNFPQPTQKKISFSLAQASTSSRSTSNNNSKSIKRGDLWNFKSAFNNSYKHYCSCVCRCIVLSAGTAEKSATIYNNKITCCYQQTEQWESYIHAPSWIPHIFKLLSCYHLHIKFYCLIYGWLMLADVVLVLPMVLPMRELFNLSFISFTFSLLLPHAIYLTPTLTLDGSFICLCIYV